MQPEYPSRRRTSSKKEKNKCWRLALEPEFGLSILGYCRNKVAWHVWLCRKGPAPLCRGDARMDCVLIILRFIFIMRSLLTVSAALCTKSTLWCNFEHIHVNLFPVCVPRGPPSALMALIRDLKSHIRCFCSQLQSCLKKNVKSSSAKSTTDGFRCKATFSKAHSIFACLTEKQPITAT